MDVLKCKYNELPFHPTDKPDIVYLTYKERQAETSFKHLLKKYPNLKRLHGIKGLCNAFRCSAEIVKSDYYILIDGDNQVLDSFDLYSLSRPTQNTMSFCKTRNPVNDLIYGYGGIKSCPTENFRSISDDKLGPIASGGIQKGHCIPVVASITAFNTSPFNAWKAGFRESVMLLNQDNEISMNHDEIMHKLAV